jgi:glycosyltransferase involved in cell wall biosynthesis
VALLPHLVERGFDLELAVLHDRAGLQAEVGAAGVVLHDLSGSGGRAGWVRRLRSLLAERRPDLVHTSLFEADLCGRVAAASRRVPVVSTMATEHYGQAHLGAQHLERGKVRAAQLADAATARLARRLHAVSVHVADTMARHLRYPRDRIDVVYRGRPAELAAGRPAGDRERIREALGAGDRPIVLMTARHEPAKGIDRLIAALPLVVTAQPDALLVVAGREGSHTPALRAAAVELGLEASVRLLGHRDDVADLLVAADAFVLPSRREGLPGSLLEAMAAGTPAVVADLPQVLEVASDREAAVVDAADAAALGAAVVDVLANAGPAAARAAMARRRFLDHFTLDRSADGMASFYRRSLSPDLAGGGAAGHQASVRNWRQPWTSPPRWPRR